MSPELENARINGTFIDCSSYSRNSRDKCGIEFGTDPKGGKYETHSDDVRCYPGFELGRRFGG
jgi:hypothetical protein